MPDTDTVFNLGSLCKGFTALAVACLVADGKVTWDDRIDKFLPDLRASPNGAFSIRDLLSHRSGLCRSDALFIGSDNQLLLTKSQGIEVYASLAASSPPRQDFIYNNFGYHAVGCVIEQVSSMNYGDFLMQRIFKPLGMTRTFTKPPPQDDDNIAQGYMPYSDLTLRQVPPPTVADDTVAFAAGCIRSCMRDLLRFYSSALDTFSEVIPRPASDELVSQFIWGDTHAMFDANIPLKAPGIVREQSYGMGWARTQLPNQMSELSGNSGLLSVYGYPTIGGDGDSGPLVFHHGGNNIGCSSSVFIFPELRSGIIVLGNALGHCDAPDWAAQVITEAYLRGGIHTPFVDLAKEAASVGRSGMAQNQSFLDAQKRGKVHPSGVDRYVGVYWHTTKQFKIVITLCAEGEAGKLSMAFQGLDTERYELRHSYRDTFEFNETFDQIVDRGQWCRSFDFYKIEFLSRDEDSEVYGLRWRIGDSLGEGQVFEKES